MRSELVSRVLRLESVLHARVMHCCILVLLVVFALTMAYGQTQATIKPEAVDVTPQPAVSAILSAFDKYEVVGRKMVPRLEGDTSLAKLETIRAALLEVEDGDVTATSAYTTGTNGRRKKKENE